MDAPDPAGLGADFPGLARRSKACVNCVRIKCKCIPRSEGGCERCHRLGKTCLASMPPASARRPGRPRRAGSRTQRLEAKIGDLVDLLRTQQGVGETAQGLSGLSVPGLAHGALQMSPDGTALGSPVSRETVAGSPVEGGDARDPTPAEAEELLRQFREEMLPYDPIVYIPPSTTALQLRHEAPFLWLCIMAVASSSADRRWGLGGRARRYFLDRIIGGGERSIALLHGTLVLLTWYHALPSIDRPMTLLLSQVTIAEAWDLGLGLPPPLYSVGSNGAPAAHTTHTASTPSATPRFIPPVAVDGMPAAQLKRERSREERRTILAVYSATNCLPHMPDGLRWSAYLEECLGVLASGGAEHVAQDATLVRHVRLRLLAHQLRQAAAWSGSGSGGAARAGLAPAVPVTPIFLEAVQRYLDSILDDATALENFTTHNLYYYITLAIHESVLIRPPAGTALDLRRFAIYQRCFDAVRHSFDRFFAIPADRYLRLPCSTACQLFYVTVCLQKLSTLRDPSWNTEVVRDTLDLLPTMDRVMEIFQTCRRAVLPQPLLGTEENCVAAFVIRKFQALRNLWQNEMPPRQPGLAPTPSSNTDTAATLGPGPGPLPVDLAASPSSVMNFNMLDYYHLLPDLGVDLAWM